MKEFQSRVAVGEYKKKNYHASPMWHLMAQEGLRCKIKKVLCYLNSSE